MSTQQHIDYQNVSLEELAAYTQQGHQEAFRHIVQQCNQRLFRTAIAVLNNDHDAQDALQNAYINAYQHISSFKGNAKLTTWLTRIVLNECYQLRRRQQQEIELEALDNTSNYSVIPFPNRSSAMKDPIANTSQHELRQLLETSISKLPSKYRTVLMLRDIEQLSTQETAEILALNLQTVKTQLHRARQQLKTELSKHIVESLDDTFLFLGSRCANMTEQVMKRIAKLENPPQN